MQNAVIVLVDISGYTRFIKLHGLALAHAEGVISKLLDSVIDHTEHPLTLNKLEGDAALFYAPAGSNPQVVAESVLRQVNGFFKVFSTRKQEIGVDALCNCGGCTEAVHLNIKTVVAFGGIVVRKVRQFEEISGTPVIVAHRLLKNSVPLDEYVLLTEDFENVLGERPAGGTSILEQCEGIGEVKVSYYSPNPYAMLPPAPSLKRQIGLVSYAVTYVAKRYIRNWIGAAPQHKFRNLMGD